MKFWQYALGVGLAILLFSGAVFSEYSKYQRISFLEENPFSLLGEHDYPEKGHRDLFNDNGEFIRIFGDSQIDFTKESREILNGHVFLVGNFFNDDDPKENFINLGNLVLRYPASNVLISRDSETDTSTILNYGRTIELYFPNEEIPFLIPSEAQIIINDVGDFPLSKNENYYQYSKEFQLSLIDWSDDLSGILKKGVEDFYVIRRSFKSFATKMYNTWIKDSLDFLKFDFLRKTKTSPEVDSFLSRLIQTQQSFEKTDKAYKRVAEAEFSDMGLKLEDESLKTLLETNEKWTLFEKSQKIWLPSINNNSPEWLYRKLWNPKNDHFSNAINALDNAEFFSFNLYGEAIDEELFKLKNELSDVPPEELSKFYVSSIRRRFCHLMKAQLEYENINRTNIKNLSFFIEKELEQYKNDLSSLILIKDEITYNLIDVITHNINREDDFSRYLVSTLIGTLQNNIDLDEFIKKVDEETAAAIDVISMVGVSGLTPEEYEELHNIKEEEEALNNLIERPVDIPEEKRGITNSKKLWEFLRTKNINIDIQSFRTKRNSLYFETRFENTESGTKKISGIFDYNKQVFKILTLGTASIRKIQPNSLSLWIKQIGGKFEPIEIEEEKPEIIDDPIPQNSRKAIVNKQFLKDLLVSLNFTVSKSNITVISHDLNKMNATDITLDEDGIENRRITLDYNLKSREFYNVFATKDDGSDKIYLSESPINDKTLQELVREKFKIEESEE